MRVSTYEWQGAARDRLRPLFAHAGHSCLLEACLDGSMGRALCIHPSLPYQALLMIGDFTFLGGEPAPGAGRLLRPLVLENKERLLLAPSSWHMPLTQALGGRLSTITRFALRPPERWDTALLTAMAKLPAAGYEWVPIADIYEETLAEEWRRDWVSVFDNEADYKERGLGFALRVEGEIVAGASSYVVSRRAIEIQIDTRMDFRQQGLAARCAARLILACLARGILPCWDAANLPSLNLAQKLGYQPEGAYPVYLISKPDAAIEANGKF